MSERSSGGGRELYEPIGLPDGRRLATFRDAATSMLALSANERQLPEWQAAAEALLLVVELGGPTMFARIGFMAHWTEATVVSSIHRRRSIARGAGSSRGTNDGLHLHQHQRACWR
jgi:hypothetical protein